MTSLFAIAIDVKANTIATKQRPEPPVDLRVGVVGVVGVVGGSEGCAGFGRAVRDTCR